jgi:hypothetical protein
VAAAALVDPEPSLFSVLSFVYNLKVLHLLEHLADNGTHLPLVFDD